MKRRKTGRAGKTKAAPAPQPREPFLLDAGLIKSAGELNAEELRELANIFERWVKQCRFKADMISHHTLTGRFMGEHLGN